MIFSLLSPHPYTVLLLFAPGNVANSVKPQSSHVVTLLMLTTSAIFPRAASEPSVDTADTILVCQER